MKLRRQDMDVQYQITKSSGSSQKQNLVSLTDCPTFLFFLETTPLFHWHLLKTCTTHFNLFFNSHIPLPGHHLECSQCWVQSCWHDVSHRDFFASTHNFTTFVNTSFITTSSFFFIEEVHGHKCYLISHFTRTMSILWWEKLQLGIISRFQSLTIC